MPKTVARLAAAAHHPGVAVLRDLRTGITYQQLPLSQARERLGRRTEAFYLVDTRTHQILEEVPPEEVPSLLESLF